MIAITTQPVRCLCLYSLLFVKKDQEPRVSCLSRHIYNLRIYNQNILALRLSHAMIPPCVQPSVNWFQMLHVQQ